MNMTDAKKFDSTKRRRQLIGEILGNQRVVETRLFQTREEAESWMKAAAGRRIRLATVGSAAWTRALDQELWTAQKSECARVSDKAEKTPTAVNQEAPIDSGTQNKDGAIDG
jgi:hypothetical protein